MSVLFVIVVLISIGLIPTDKNTDHPISLATCKKVFDRSTHTNRIYDVRLRQDTGLTTRTTVTVTVRAQKSCTVQKNPKKWQSWLCICKTYQTSTHIKMHLWRITYFTKVTKTCKKNYIRLRI